MADQARTRSRVDEGYSGKVVLFSFMNQSRFQITMTTNLRPRGLRLISDNLFRLSFQIVNPEIIKPELDRGWTLLSQYSLLPHDSFIPLFRRPFAADTMYHHLELKGAPVLLLVPPNRTFPFVVP